MGAAHHEVSIVRADLVENPEPRNGSYNTTKMKKKKEKQRKISVKAKKQTCSERGTAGESNGDETMGPN